MVKMGGENGKNERMAEMDVLMSQQARTDERLHEHDEAINEFKELHAQQQTQTALIQQLLESDREWKRATERRVCALEAIPAKRWEQTVNQVLSLAVSAGLGGLIVTLLGK